MKQNGTKSEPFNMYEAILDGVFFDWLSQSTNIKDAETECRQYLNEFTNGYIVTSFKLKDRDVKL